jgi:predicted kinase
MLDARVLEHMKVSRPLSVLSSYSVEARGLGLNCHEVDGAASLNRAELKLQHFFGGNTLSKAVVFLVGAPGAGKSTFATRLSMDAKDNQVCHLNLDDVVNEHATAHQTQLTSGIYPADVKAWAQNEVAKRFQQIILEGRCEQVIWECCILPAASDSADFAAQHGWSVLLLHMNLRLETCLKRVAERNKIDRHTPQDVVVSKHKGCAATIEKLLRHCTAYCVCNNEEPTAAS